MERSVESILIHCNNDFEITPFTLSLQPGVEVDVEVLAFPRNRYGSLSTSFLGKHIIIDSVFNGVLA